MVTREIEDEYSLRFRRRWAVTPRVSKINDESKVLEGRALEKPVFPDLESNIFSMAGTPIACGVPEFCAVGDGGETR